MSENFTKVFHDTLDKIEKDAKDVGLNLTSICKATEISRATPDRWRKTVPKTIKLIEDMQNIIEEKRKINAEDAIVRARHAK